MILFVVVVSIYIACLCLIKIEPKSLRKPLLGYAENIRMVRASLLLGVLLSVVFLVSTDFKFMSITSESLLLFSMSNRLDDWYLWPMQLVSSCFVHSDISHFLSNLYFLGLLSVYERQVGIKRFLSVLSVGLLVSGFSVFFYSETTSSLGFSGGLYGLAAAYITDKKGLTKPQWLTSICLFFLVAVIVAIRGSLESASDTIRNFPIDHYGHILGAVAAIIYCRFASLRMVPKPPVIKVESMPVASLVVRGSPIIKDELKVERSEPTPYVPESDGKAVVLDGVDDDGGATKILVVHEDLIVGLLKTLENYDEDDRLVKEEVLNVFFRIEDRLKRFFDDTLKSDQILSLIADSNVRDHHKLFIKYLG